MSSPDTTRTPVVWIVNRAGHPVSKAEKFGRILSLTTGAVNPFRPDRLLYLIGTRLQQAHRDDYVLISGLPIINALVTAMWLQKFPYIRFLQWSSDSKDYKEVVVTHEAVYANIFHPPEPAE